MKDHLLKIVSITTLVVFTATGFVWSAPTSIYPSTETTYSDTQTLASPQDLDTIPTEIQQDIATDETLIGRVNRQHAIAQKNLKDTDYVVGADGAKIRPTDKFYGSEFTDFYIDEVKRIVAEWIEEEGEENLHGFIPSRGSDEFKFIFHNGKAEMVRSVIRLNKKLDQFFDQYEVISFRGVVTRTEMKAFQNVGVAKEENRFFIDTAGADTVFLTEEEKDSFLELIKGLETTENEDWREITQAIQASPELDPERKGYNLLPDRGFYLNEEGDLIFRSKKTKKRYAFTKNEKPKRFAPGMSFYFDFKTRSEIEGMEPFQLTTIVVKKADQSVKTKTFDRLESKQANQGIRFQIEEIRKSYLPMGAVTPQDFKGKEGREALAIIIEKLGLQETHDPSDGLTIDLAERIADLSQEKEKEVMDASLIAVADKKSKLFLREDVAGILQVPESLLSRIEGIKEEIGNIELPYEKEGLKAEKYFGTYERDELGPLLQLLYDKPLDKREDRIHIVRAPPNTFYIIIERKNRPIEVVMQDYNFFGTSEVFEERFEKEFVESRRRRRAQNIAEEYNVSELYGAKQINSTVGHDGGTDVFQALLYVAHKHYTDALDSTEVVNKEILTKQQDELMDLFNQNNEGFGTVITAIAISEDEMVKQVGFTISTIENLMRARSVTWKESYIEGEFGNNVLKRSRDYKELAQLNAAANGIEDYYEKQRGSVTLIEMNGLLNSKAKRLEEKDGVTVLPLTKDIAEDELAETIEEEFARGDFIDINVSQNRPGGNLVATWDLPASEDSVILEIPNRTGGVAEYTISEVLEWAFGYSTLGVPEGTNFRILTGEDDYFSKGETLATAYRGADDVPYLVMHINVLASARQFISYKINREEDDARYPQSWDKDKGPHKGTRLLPNYTSWIHSSISKMIKHEIDDLNRGEHEEDIVPVEAFEQIRELWIFHLARINHFDDVQFGSSFIENFNERENAVKGRGGITRLPNRSNQLTMHFPMTEYTDFLSRPWFSDIDQSTIGNMMERYIYLGAEPVDGLFLLPGEGQQDSNKVFVVTPKQMNRRSLSFHFDRPWESGDSVFLKDKFGNQIWVLDPNSLTDHMWLRAMLVLLSEISMTKDMPNEITFDDVVEIHEEILRHQQMKQAIKNHREDVQAAERILMAA